MTRLKQGYYGSCFVASCIHLQLKQVDPFITKRAHQILVVWAHGPIPYYSSEIPWYWLHLPEIMVWGHPPIAAIEAHDRKSTSWRQRIKSFRVAAGDDLWHAAQCRGHLHPRFLFVFVSVIIQRRFSMNFRPIRSNHDAFCQHLVARLSYFHRVLLSNKVFKVNSSRLLQLIAMESWLKLPKKE